MDRVTEIMITVEITFSNFSCLIGTEIIHFFDVALPLLHKIDMNGGSKNPIIKIHAFQSPISKAGISDIF